MSSVDYLTRLLAAFRQAFQPLTDALTSPEKFSKLLADLGWGLDTATDMASVEAAFTTVSAAIEKLEQDATFGNALILAADISQVTTAVFDLESSSGSGLPAPLNTREFWDTFPRDLLDYLTYRFLRDHTLRVFGILRFAGVAGEKPEPANPATGRAEFTRRTVDWSRIPNTVARADHLFADIYGWGSSFNHQLFIDNLAALLVGFQLAAVRQRPPRFLLDAYYDPANPERWHVNWITASPLVIRSRDSSGAGVVKLSVGVFPIPPADDLTAPPEGIALAPLVTGAADAGILLGENVSAVVSGGFAAAFVRLEIRPTETKAVVQPMETEVHASLQLLAQRAPAWVPIGDPGSTRFEFDKAHVAIAAEGEPDDPDKIDCRIDLGIDSGKLVLDLTEGDGFLREVIGTGVREIPFAPKASWSNRTGFRIENQGLLEVRLPVHFKLAGVLRLDTLYVGLGASPDGTAARLMLALSGSLALGPLVAAVDRMGIEVLASPRDKTSPGNLGLLDVRFGFKPPNGVGLSIDAGPVVGGGYLFFDNAKEEYAGILQLEFQETITLTAIGLLTTRMPDGSKGFSLLIIISAQDFTPIQLGYGFTLNGVGGLLGVNRTVVVDVLRAGIKNRTLDSVLFPEDPVRNAAQIISSLRAVFPPAENRYVFGPMAIIGWGTPTMVTIELGIVLEVPAPVRLVIIGQVRAFLPDPELPLITLQMDALGVIDFDKGDASVDATLYDSRLIQYVLTGDMALRANWGASPTFVLAVGGLHPKFQPPPNFPKLDRIAVSLATGDNPRLRLETYLALTSNTAQIGARLEVYAKEGGFSIEGSVGFDALFQFQPFQFVADVGGRVAVRRGGNKITSVGLDMTLTGPKPWHARGKATFEVLSIKHSVRFNARFGQEEDPPLPVAVDVATLLLEAAREERNWSGQLPQNGHPLVSVRPNGDSASVLVHPQSELLFRQRVVPLNLTISRFGNTTPSGDRFFALREVKLNGRKVNPTPVTEYFAPAQFFEMSDDDKLSRSSFEPMEAGIRFRTDTTHCKDPVRTPIEYETIIVDPRKAGPNETVKNYPLPSKHLPALALLGAAGRAAFRRTGRGKYRTPGPGIAVRDGVYMVASTEKLEKEPIPGLEEGETFTYTKAADALRSFMAAHPEQRGSLQIVRNIGDLKNA